MALDPHSAMMVKALQNQPTPQGMQNHAGNPMQLAGDVVPMTPNTNLSADELYNRVLQPGGMNQIGRNGGLSTMPPNVATTPAAMQWYLRQGYPIR